MYMRLGAMMGGEGGGERRFTSGLPKHIAQISGN